ncbi:MAG: hypothetical protein OXC81_03915, partial [Betaproteobacteria bacterium]|nr:hypothetical protein [Betaproteobacteria bacterium]
SNDAASKFCDYLEYDKIVKGEAEKNISRSLSETIQENLHRAWEGVQSSRGDQLQRMVLSLTQMDKKDPEAQKAASNFIDSLKPYSDKYKRTLRRAWDQVLDDQKKREKLIDMLDSYYMGHVKVNQETIIDFVNSLHPSDRESHPENPPTGGKETVGTV